MFTKVFGAIAIIVVIIIMGIAEVSAQTTYDKDVQDPAIKQLVKDRDDMERAIRALVAKYDKLEKDFKAFKQSGGGAGDGGKTTIIREVGGGKDVHAQQSANRALAWAVRLSFTKVRTVEKTQVYSTDNGWSGRVKLTKESFVTYPDIEEVEAMLSPIVRGNMSPAKFEKAVLDAATKAGWTYLTAPAREAIIAEAIAEATKAAEKVAGDVAKKEVEKLLAEFKKTAEEYKAAAQSIDTLAKTEQERLTTLAAAIDKAIEAASKYEKSVDDLAKAGYVTEADTVALIERELADTKGKVSDLETRYDALKQQFLSTSSKIARSLRDLDTEKTSDKKKIRSNADEVVKDLDFYEKTGQPPETE